MPGDIGAGQVVVGAAIVRDGLLLAQQRAYPQAAAGRWELPGGHVEPGENEHDALARECAEELAIVVRPGRRVGPDVPLRPGLLLRVYSAELDPPDAVPRAVEHRALRWVAAADLDGLDWLPADRALLPALHALLA